MRSYTWWGTPSLTHLDRRPSMKRTMVVGACVLLLVLAGSPLVMGGQMPMGSQAMMGMMCPMMGGQMDPSGMMSMMGSGEIDPKAMARMLELRGDLLKAMGEVMLKHAKAMEAGR
jgi:hypothetical protein